MAVVYISIGSNIDREHHIRSAVVALQKQFGHLQLSPVYETEAFGFDGDPFYNLVARFETAPLIDAQQLITWLHAIEDRNGRQRGDKKFSSRTLDIDLLLFGNDDLRSHGLDVPRDEITRYAFVLGPLADLAPADIHPLTGRSYQQLWADFQATSPVVASAMTRVPMDW